MPRKTARSHWLTWSRGKVTTDLLLGYLGPRRVATVSPNTHHYNRSFELAFLLPDLKGVHPLERGFETPEAAKQRAEELVTEFMADMKRIIQ